MMLRLAHWDKIYAAGSSRLFSKIALNGYSAFDIPFHKLHSDTSSPALYGEYSECDSPAYDGVHITEGFSKDHRPDLSWACFDQNKNDKIVFEGLSQK
ncbi:hypothetical protein [Sporomusa carbonis]|uniref:hypothetical protein n=1 Tax=Sporomusa carbonis TaxID=3076075 RepID=UPI003C7CC5BB